MRAPVTRWLALLAGCATIALFVAGLHRITPHVGGATGAMIESNRSHDREVWAYFYTEVGDLEEFLDDEEGRYGKRAADRASAPRGAPHPRSTPSISSSVSNH